MKNNLLHLDKEMQLLLEETKAKIVSIFSMLSNEKFSTDAYDLILFLLTAYKHELITEKSRYEKIELFNELKLKLSEQNNENIDILYKLIDYYRPDFEKLSDYAFNFILNQVLDINLSKLNNIYHHLFESILDRIINSNITYAGEFYQSSELTNFLCKISNSNDTSKIFNPFGGLASFGLYLNQYETYYGQEINKKFWAIGTMRLMANKNLDRAKYKLTDSILNWPSLNDKFDIIISIPPFGMQINERYRNQKGFYSIQHFIINNGINSLNENGKLITLIPEGSLNGQLLSKNVLQNLVKSDWLETIIYLPSRFFKFTSARMVVLIISKNKRYQNTVQIIDTDQLSITDKNNNIKVNFDSIENIISDHTETSSQSRSFSKIEIIKNNYNFLQLIKIQPKKYLDLKSKLWKVFDILRNENINTDDYYLVLFILSLYKDKILNCDVGVESNNIKVQIESALKIFENNLEKGYNYIFKIFEPILNDLSNDGFTSIVKVICDLDHEILSKHFSELFDDILFNLTQSQGRNAGKFIQPVELTRFIYGLADLKEDAKVFNPFAGLASFGVYLDQGQVYFGQELNQKTWALGALRLIAYERQGSSKYVCDDSILHWPDESEKFDLILSNPPFGMRLGHHYRDIEPNIRTIEQFLIEKGIQSLKQNGKLIALLTQGFLFRGIHVQRLREHLVEEDLIDTIISLPGGLLLNTGIPLIILVLNRNKKLPGRVKFVDAKNFVNAKGHREKVLNDYSLNSFIHSDKEDDDIVKIVYNEQIRDNDYNLSVARYFQKQITGVKLGDILELVRGQRGNLPETGKLIRIRDLKDDKVDYTLDISSVEETELRRPDIHLVSEACLLLAMRWRSLKPTLFEFKGEPIYRSQDILSFKVNEAIADKAYLINELQADYVQEQLETYRLGASVMPSIRKDDLMEVVIKLPSLQEQRAKVQGVYELSDKIKSLQEERNALAHGKTIMQFNEFASLKHTLGRPRQNILDWSDNLIDFLTNKKEGFEALNKAFSEYYDIEIISALKEIKRDVNFITDLLEKGENGLVLSKYEKRVIPLTDINSIINELSNNGFNFKIKLLLLKGEKLKERGIYANKTLFKTLLDNILTNANKYAFDKKATGNEVVIELNEVNDSLAIEIRNNGKPFPKNFDREKFVTKYSTADSSNGSGLGGYDIHRIASYFNNPDWILSLNEDPFFLVKFKFQFPIKLIN